MFKNLFDAHPPFQIDGNFGYTSGVVEMLLQSHEDRGIRLLPALPKAWESGYIKGLTARGNITVDMKWSEGVLRQLTVNSLKDQSATFIYRDHVYEFDLKKEKPFVFQFK
jgi:alpha-L-fucosidase 2